MSPTAESTVRNHFARSGRGQPVQDPILIKQAVEGFAMGHALDVSPVDHLHFDESLPRSNMVCSIPSIPLSAATLSDGQRGSRSSGGHP